MRDIRFGGAFARGSHSKSGTGAAGRVPGHGVHAGHWDSERYCAVLHPLTIALTHSNILVWWQMITFHLCMKFLFVYKEILTYTGVCLRDQCFTSIYNLKAPIQIFYFFFLCDACISPPVEKCYLTDIEVSSKLHSHYIAQWVLKNIIETKVDNLLNL